MSERQQDSFRFREELDAHITRSEQIGDEPYVFPNNPVAKSSTNVLQASVCQSCGCKLDGKIESMKKECKCRCHKEGPR